MPVHQVAGEFGREIDPDRFPYSGYLMLDILRFLTAQGVPINRTELKFRTDPDAAYATVLTHNGAGRTWVGEGFTFPGGYKLLDAEGMAANAATCMTVM